MHTKLTWWVDYGFAELETAFTTILVDTSAELLGAELFGGRTHLEDEDRYRPPVEGGELHVYLFEGALPKD